MEIEIKNFINEYMLAIDEYQNLLLCDNYGSNVNSSNEPLNSKILSLEREFYVKFVQHNSQFDARYLVDDLKNITESLFDDFYRMYMENSADMIYVLNSLEYDALVQFSQSVYPTQMMENQLNEMISLSNAAFSNENENYENPSETIKTLRDEYFTKYNNECCSCVKSELEKTHTLEIKIALKRDLIVKISTSLNMMKHLEIEHTVNQFQKCVNLSNSEHNSSINFQEELYKNIRAKYDFEQSILFEYDQEKDFSKKMDVFKRFQTERSFYEEKIRQCYKM